MHASGLLVVRRLVVAATVACGTALIAAAVSPAVPTDDVTLRGCVERDAAASAAVYKLIVNPPASPRIYRMTVPKDIDVASQVGRSVDATGTVEGAGEARGQRQEPVLVVKKLTRVSDSCASPDSLGPDKP